jgi:hypothetical protein
MIKFKELNTFLETLFEGEYTAGGGAARSAHSDYGVHRVENPEQVGRINTFLNAFTQREFIEPKAAVAQLRHKFNTVGLDFDWNATSNIKEDGTMNIPLNRFGGTFGKSMQTPYAEFETTDGIKEYNNGKGLNLQLNVSNGESGLYKLDAKIVESKE